MSEPSWVPLRQIVLMHGLSIAFFGGASGVRDENLLSAAATRSPTKWQYGERRLAMLAAAYAFALAKYHPFVDGNKRVALATAQEFLRKNGRTIAADPDELTAIFLALAAGTLSEDQLGEWLAAHSAEVPPDTDHSPSKPTRRDLQ